MITFLLQQQQKNNQLKQIVDVNFIKSELTDSIMMPMCVSVSSITYRFCAIKFSQKLQFYVLYAAYTVRLIWEPAYIIVHSPDFLILGNLVKLNVIEKELWI